MATAITKTTAIAVWPMGACYSLLTYVMDVSGPHKAHHSHLPYSALKLEHSQRAAYFRHRQAAPAPTSSM